VGRQFFTEFGQWDRYPHSTEHISFSWRSLGFGERRLLYRLRCTSFYRMIFSISADCHILCRYKMSVRPSLTHQYYVETAKHVCNNNIIRFFPPSGIHTILVYPYHGNISTGPPNRTSNAGGVWTIAILDQYLTLSQK